MSVESVVAAGRVAAEARMLSRVAVMRRTGDVTTDPDGFEVPVWATVHADLRFRLGGAERGGAGSRVARVGEAELQLAVRVGHFPADTDGLAEGDLVEVTAGENTGAVLRIVEASWQDQATARRVPVVEEQRPEEWS